MVYLVLFNSVLLRLRMHDVVDITVVLVYCSATVHGRDQCQPSELCILISIACTHTHRKYKLTTISNNTQTGKYQVYTGRKIKTKILKICINKTKALF